MKDSIPFEAGGPLEARLVAIADDVEAAVAAAGLPDGFRSTLEVSRRDRTDFVELLVARGWPSSDPSADIVEYVLTARFSAGRLRLEVYLGTDQGEELLPTETFEADIPTEERALAHVEMLHHHETAQRQARTRAIRGALAD